VKILVFRCAAERATSTPRLSEGGEETKEDGAEESEDEIHIEKAQDSRLGGSKVVRGFYSQTCHPAWTAQADVGHGIYQGTIGQIPGLDRV
jgi:hypothetical protein